MNPRKLFDGWVILAIFLIIILIAINIPYTTMEPYNEQEYYTESIEYIENTTFTEQEAYIENAPLNTFTASEWSLKDDRIHETFELGITINNTGNFSGEFWVAFHVESTRGRFDNVSERVFLKPHESHQFNDTFNGIYTYFFYEVFQTTKEVTKYRDVNKEMPVTKHRELQKSRDVVKFKELKLSLIERILKNTVIW